MGTIDRVPPVPTRAPDSHKGHFGHVLVLAGSPRMTGAALLTTLAALRSGAGLVTLGVPQAIHHLVAPALLSAMSLPLPCGPEGSFSIDAVPTALEFAANADAIALGPGITTEPGAVGFANRIALRARVPLVLDADGLNCLAQTDSTLGGTLAPRILTPHPGEAARLLDTTTKSIQQDRIGATGAMAQRFGAVVALKGHETVVSDGESVYVNRTGNPGMATGGSGDVLTGIMASLLASGMSPLDSAILGVHVHGLAGDLAAKEFGEISLTAKDLIDHLGAAFLARSGKSTPPAV